MASFLQNLQSKLVECNQYSLLPSKTWPNEDGLDVAIDLTLFGENP